jgi:F0F1-type ATP synthase epsilon subunit
VRDDEVSILTNDATPAETIELAAARKALENAQTMAGATAESAEERRRALTRARALVRIAEKVGGR